MNKLRILFYIFFAVFIAGCDTPVSEKTLFSVDFNKDEAVRYRFISERTIDTNWNPDEQKPGTSKITSESIDMVIKYVPVEVNPYGITTIEAYCESIKASISGSSRKDAAETIAGKSFKITVGPNGKIHDRTELVKVIQEAGKSAFRKDGNIKDPDLIEDFAATQWFLWDSVSSIEKPIAGLKVGQKWQSKLPVPNSMVIRPVRDVTYKLAEIRQTDNGRIAVITSTYELADSVPEDWSPLPWSGRFQLAGQFGFFRSMFQGLNVTSIEGQGEELFNIDLGRTESYEQSYKVKIKTGGSPLPGADPIIAIEQRISMQLLPD